jgi:uncharacterized DUF497 family protein
MLLGLSNKGWLLVAVHAEQSGTIRIISARGGRHETIGVFLFRKY